MFQEKRLQPVPHGKATSKFRIQAATLPNIKGMMTKSKTGDALMYQKGSFDPQNHSNDQPATEQ
jgi:hypothetical protein